MTMINMSYCRYENTLLALRECLNDVGEHVNEEAECTVSKREIGCFKSIVAEFWCFLVDNELINEDGELSDSSLNEVCEKMAQSFDSGDF